MNFNNDLPLRSGIQYPNGSLAKRKRTRTAFTTSQVEALEEVFRQTRFIDSNRRFQLAAELQLTERTIKVWFQNRRMKDKREKADCSNLTVEYNDLSQRVHVDNGYIHQAAQPHTISPKYLHVPPSQPLLASCSRVRNHFIVDNRYMYPAEQPMPMPPLRKYEPLNGVGDSYIAENRHVDTAAQPMVMPPNFAYVPLQQDAPVNGNGFEVNDIASKGYMDPAEHLQLEPLYPDSIPEIEPYQPASSYYELPPAPQQQLENIELPEEVQPLFPELVRIAFNLHNDNSSS